MNPITTIADEMERDGNACRASSAPEYVVAGDKILGYVKKLRALAAPVAGGQEFGKALDAYAERRAHWGTVGSLKERATVERLYAQAAQAVKVPEPLPDGMWKCSKLIAELQRIHVMYGDTCVWSKELKWGAAALNAQSDAARLNTNAKEGS